MGLVFLRRVAGALADTGRSAAAAAGGVVVCSGGAAAEEEQEVVTLLPRTPPSGGSAGFQAHNTDDMMPGIKRSHLSAGSLCDFWLVGHLAFTDDARARIGFIQGGNLGGFSR